MNTPNSPCLRIIEHYKPNANPILPVLVKLKTNGLSDITLEGYARTLRRLDKKTDLNDVNGTVFHIMNLHVSNAWKRNMLFAYIHYLDYYEFSHNIKIPTAQSKSVKIPTTEDLVTLITRARHPLNVKLRLLKETGLRPIEAIRLLAKEFDYRKQLIYPTTAKGGSARTLKISTELAEQIQHFIIKNDRQPNQTLFGTTSKALREGYMNTRNRTAKALKQPHLRNIRLYDFRHYFATMLYAKTRDILFVKKQMGHKKIDTTLIYAQLIQYEDNDKFTCKVARTEEEMTDLIEHGFEFIHEKEGIAFFRKRK